MKSVNAAAPPGPEACDNSPTICRAADNASSASETKPHSGDASLLSDPLRGSRGLDAGVTHNASLPRAARLPINRCNLPAVVLGSLSFQRHPAPLLLDGVAELHADLFRRLAAAPPATHPAVFRDYLTVHFQLEWPEEMGLTARGQGRRKGRARANYARMLRGWSFDADSREGAVLKGWVESRFGLTPRWHGQPLRDPAGEAYRRYLEMRSRGLYGTNALEAQFDLVYTFCQYELDRRHPGARHVTLYRGVNRMAEHEVLEKGSRGHHVVLLNNLNSFTCSRERAGEFGDYLLAAEVPLSKIFFHCGLLPGVLQGEDEFLVIGGVADVVLSTM